MPQGSRKSARRDVDSGLGQTDSFDDQLGQSNKHLSPGTSTKSNHRAIGMPSEPPSDEASRGSNLSVRVEDKPEVDLQRRDKRKNKEKITASKTLKRSHSADTVESSNAARSKLAIVDAIAGVGAGFEAQARRIRSPAAPRSRTQLQSTRRIRQGSGGNEVPGESVRHLSCDHASC